MKFAIRWRLVCLCVCLAFGIVTCLTSVADAGQDNMQSERSHRESLRDRLYERLEARRSQPATRRESGDYIPFMSGGLDRRYILTQPERRTHDGPLPLIIVLHGTYGSGAKMQQALGFDKYVNRYGFAVAYPDAYTPPGSKRTLRWNDGRETLGSTNAGVNDVQAIRDLVEDVARRIPLDRERIFVTGASNGGIMSYRLACEAADLIAGAAPVIGNIAEPLRHSCSPIRPVSLLAINGTDDPFIPLNGGTVCKNVSRTFCEGGEVVSSLNSLEVFARRAGCRLTPRHTLIPPVVQDGTQVELIRFEACTSAPGKTVQAYWIHGGGHTWPPRSGQLGEKSGKASGNIDATQEVIRFFLQIRR